MGLSQPARVDIDPGLFTPARLRDKPAGSFLLMKKPKATPTGNFSVIISFGTDFSDDICNTYI
jgi:hypothetical protein